MISILICTHNRANILPYCLDSLVTQTASQDLFEVIVVDNHSIDNTKNVTLSFTGKIKNLRYVYEEVIGLSHARNRGYKEAVYDWVSYVDDDAKAYTNYIERVLWVIEHYHFDCFGGRFFPWYQEPKPKWLPEDFGRFPLLLDSIGVLPNSQYVAGGVIVFRKSILFEVGGFPISLGMSGTQVGYGEENWVQDELRKHSYRIGFDPNLKIDHLVASYKFELRWHVRRQYARGRAARILEIGKQKKIVPLLGWAILVTMKELVRNSLKWVSQRNYYYQNYLLDSFGLLFRTIGYMKG